MTGRLARAGLPRSQSGSLHQARRILGYPIAFCKNILTQSKSDSPVRHVLQLCTKQLRTKRRWPSLVQLTLIAT